MSKVLFLSLWLCLFLLKDTVVAVDEFTSTPPSAVTIVEGKMMNLTWILKMASGSSFISAKVQKLVGGVEKASMFYSQSDLKSSARDGWVGREADLSLNVAVSGLQLTIQFLLANVNKTTDEAEYEVTSSSDQDTEESPKTSLTINVPPTITSSHPYNIIVTIESQTVDLVCNATGFPTPTVNWTSDGVVIGTGSPISIQVTPLDYNRCYTCVVFNGVYGAKTAKVCLISQIPPTITSSHRYTITAIESQTVDLVCNATGFPTPTVNWTRNGVVIGTRSPFSIQVTRQDHNRCYTCVVFNVYGSKTAKVCLTLQTPPTITSSRATERQTVELVCNATGFPTPTVNWIQNGVVIGTGSPFSTIATALGIDRCYTCVVFNVHGAKTASVCPNVKSSTNCPECAQAPAIVLGVVFGVSLALNFILVVYIIWNHRKEIKGKFNKRSNNKNKDENMTSIALQEQPVNAESRNVVLYETIDDEQTRQTQNTATYQSVTPCTNTYNTLNPDTRLHHQPAGIINDDLRLNGQEASHA